MTIQDVCQLGLEELKALAKSDIESKLSADNILAELFSAFTAKSVPSFVRSPFLLIVLAAVLAT